MIDLYPDGCAKISGTDPEYQNNNPTQILCIAEAKVWQPWLSNGGVFRRCAHEELRAHLRVKYFNKCPDLLKAEFADNSY